MSFLRPPLLALVALLTSVSLGARVGRWRVITAGLCVAAGVFAVASLGADRAESPRQVQAIGTVRGFVQAFSRHDVKAALAFFASFPGSSRLPAANDCDYRTGRSVAFAGSAEVARWLRQRAADHDRLTIASIRLIGPRPSGAAIYYSLRTSDSIKARGYPEGLKPNIATKAIFAARGPVRLTSFANDNGVDRPCGP